jgi:glycosyltransferase involved in cell wall biosynthesis
MDYAIRSTVAGESVRFSSEAFVKICLLLSTFAYDGIKRSVVHFANAMQDMGHEVWVGVLHEWEGTVSLRPELKLPPERVVSWDGLGQGRREWAMYRFFREQKFDVVHANTIKMNHLGRWLGWLARVPCLVASEDNLCLKRSWKTRLEDRILAYLGDAVVMISKSVEQSFLEVERLPAHKVHTVYYGLPISQFEKYRKSESALVNKRKELGIPMGPTVVCAARLHFSKSLDTLIHAAKLVVDRLPQAQFVLAGDGGERSKLENLRDELGLQKQFHFIGARTDIYDIFQLADIVTLCSLWEGLGFSLMEAMAYSKPVVGTNVAGINEIIVHERNGFLVPKESPKELSEAFLKILTNPELKQKMGIESTRVVSERFDVQRNAKQLIDLYRGIPDAKRV